MQLFIILNVLTKYQIIHSIFIYILYICVIYILYLLYLYYIYMLYIYNIIMVKILGINEDTVPDRIEKNIYYEKCTLIINLIFYY